MAVWTLEAFRETQISVKSYRSSSRIWRTADSTIPSGVTPYRAFTSRSREPLLTPMRMGMPRRRQASATCLT